MYFRHISGMKPLHSRWRSTSTTARLPSKPRQRNVTITTDPDPRHGPSPLEVAARAMQIISAGARISKRGV